MKLLATVERHSDMELSIGCSAGKKCWLLVSRNMRQLERNNLMKKKLLRKRKKNSVKFAWNSLQKSISYVRA